VRSAVRSRAWRRHAVSRPMDGGLNSPEICCQGSRVADFRLPEAVPARRLSDRRMACAPRGEQSAPIKVVCAGAVRDAGRHLDRGSFKVAADRRTICRDLYPYHRDCRHPEGRCAPCRDRAIRARSGWVDRIVSSSTWRSSAPKRGTVARSGSRSRIEPSAAGGGDRNADPTIDRLTRHVSA
jgi:hypothetical protein